MLPFRELLKPATPFRWDSNLNQLFEESKTAITGEIVNGVKIFDKSKPKPALLQIGLGMALAFGCSRSIACAHQMISSVVVMDGTSLWLVADLYTLQNPDIHRLKERLQLCMADTLDKARYFVLGCTNLIIAVDHKPLLKIFGDRSLEQISNPRLRNLKD